MGERTRRTGVLLGACLVGVGIVAIALAAATRHVPPPGDARRITLPDGSGQVAVSTRRDDLVVWWRDAGETTWSDPQVVYDAGRDIATQLRLRAGGGTVAVVATYTPPDTYYHDELSTEELRADDVTVVAACRRGSCSTSEPFDGPDYDAPQVTPDGGHALLADDAGDAGSYVTWHGGEIVVQRPEGLPSDDAVQASPPLLAPDGSLRAVSGRRAGDRCDFVLLTTEPGRAAYEPAVTFRRAARRSGCTVALETFASDYVIASQGRHAATFLSRRNATWRVVEEDPSGQVRYPRTGEPRLAGAYQRSGFWHWSEVVLSSPDGRTLVAQVHRPGETRWGPPRVVARAPQGAECTHIDPMPTYTHGEEDPFYAGLRCRSRPAPGADWAYVSATAVTDDGETWHSFLATDATRVGRDMFFSGRPSHHWSPETGLRTVPLPVPPGGRMTLLEGGDYALSTVHEVDGGCLVRVRLAGSGDTRWSAPVRSTARPVALESCAFSSVSGENRNIYHYLEAEAGLGAMVRLAWREGAPVVENAPG
jgi:hypothetical protein